ncbi:probable glycosyltransferase At5g03795 [Rosa rugosa]|uniref:probable glycosyltransferase At5g03795 n=1 Tax=Rosa rugosa TaxID=74645 RepID=UPI002B41767F|nr:probable glycosyltransferase At5g03795 [Rosa rugosa]
MSTTTATSILLFLFSLLLTTHSKPIPHLTSPYLSPATISANYDSMVKNFKIFIYKPNPHFTYDSPVQSLFYTALLDSDLATNNTDEAHLFFLPFPPDLPTRSIARLIRTIRTDLPYWNRTLGADHFYLSCSGVGYESDRGLVELKKNSIQISCFPTPPGQLIPHKDITLPPLASPHAPTTNTTTFLGYVRSNWVNDSAIVKGLRTNPEFLIESEPSTPQIYAQRLSSSKFCIFEYGDGDLSGIGEALRFGCVPVVITDRPIQDLPFMDVLRWQEMALFVGRRGGAKELERVLVRACWERHDQMRRLGTAAGQHLVWNVPPRALDAFHTLVYQLWLRRHTIRYVRRETA